MGLQLGVALCSQLLPYERKQGTRDYTFLVSVSKTGAAAAVPTLCRLPGLPLEGSGDTKRIALSWLL